MIETQVKPTASTLLFGSQIVTVADPLPCSVSERIAQRITAMDSTNDLPPMDAEMIEELNARYLKNYPTAMCSPARQTITGRS